MSLDYEWQKDDIEKNGFPYKYIFLLFLRISYI